jgi:hypothetical protein
MTQKSNPIEVAPDSDIYHLAWFPGEDWLAELAALAQPEIWNDEGRDGQPILFNYLRYTIRRQLELGQWRSVGEDPGPVVSAFNTGLLSRHFESIVAVFERNRNPDKQPWVWKEWATPSSHRLKPFESDSLLPAVFFDDPGEAVFDPRLPVVANVEHIVDDNVDRYPQALRDNPYMRKGMLEQAITVAAAKAVSNWRIAAPQYYWPPNGGAGRVQLLLPLSLETPDRVDRARPQPRPGAWLCTARVRLLPSAHRATSRVGIQERATRDTP